MRTVEDIIALLGGPEPAARHCGIGTEAVRKWRQARAIPAKHWPAILAATGLALTDLPGASPAPAAANAAPTPPETHPAMTQPDTIPEGATACLVLGDGIVRWGRGFGAHTPSPGAGAVGGVCFNTGMTGY